MQTMSIAKADLQARYDVLDQKCVEMQQEIVELRYQNQELVARVECYFVYTTMFYMQPVHVGCLQ